MEHLIITIRPTQPDDELLRVSDAMQHIIDYIKLIKEAENAIVSPEESFEWRLESASANSPFTVVAVAESTHPEVDVSSQVQKVKAEFSSGMRELIQNRRPPWWMGPDAINLARSVFTRGQNGIGRTEIKITEDETFLIDRAQADAGVKAIAAISAISVDTDISDREAWGEIEGVIVAAGRYRNRPAIQIRTDLYAYVWCQLPNAIIEKFGSEHKVKDVWSGKTLGIQGKLIYVSGGNLSRIEANDIRELESVLPIDLNSVLDPNFTSGLDPVEYLRKFHEGDLA